MSEIPAEAVQAASRAIERVMREAAHPLSYAEMGLAAVVAIVEHGYAIVSATAPHAPEASQGSETSRGGISGRSDDPQSAETLSGLREELRRTVLRRNAANAMRGVHEHRAARLKTELDHAKAALAGENEVISLFMADCTRTAERLREQVNLWQKAAEQAEAKLDRLREPHTRGPRTNTCNDCGQDWPCETIQTIDEEKPNA